MRCKAVNNITKGSLRLRRQVQMNIRVVVNQLKCKLRKLNTDGITVNNTQCVSNIITSLHIRFAKVYREMHS